MSLSLVLIDDHQVLRDTLRTVLEFQSDLNVVAEAGAGREGCAVVEEHHPDVVVMDVSLPDIDGFEAARQMRRTAKPPKILFLSMHGDEAHVARGLDAGARGYVWKQQPIEELVQAIRAVGRGEEYVPPHAWRVAIDDELTRLRQREANGEAASPPVRLEALRHGIDVGANPVFDRLTNREKEIFFLLVRGGDNQEIAGDLQISVKTVETHRSRILRKIESHTMADLVRFAARHSLL